MRLPKPLLIPVAMIALAILFNAIGLRSHPVSSWGINSKAVLAAENDPVLEDGRITFLREDINLAAADWPGHRRRLEAWRKSGKKIVGLVPYDMGLASPAAEDLRVVYAAAADLETQAGDIVDVWENQNEPDLGFTRDLPDRSTAFMKTVYLGLKDASGDTKPVLLPSLGLPPGPWFHRAADNGLLFYGDALNFHYYSHSRDFRDAIGLLQASQEAAHASGLLPNFLPVWVTEIGLDSVPLDHPGNEAGRKRQADFFRETAQIASELKLAGFMPYALVDSRAGYSLEAAPGHPYPALNAYLQSTYRFDLTPPMPWIDDSAGVSRIILQWVPDSEKTIPHKVSGAYRFLEDRSPLTGELRIYSFSKRVIQGQLKLQVAGDVASPEIGGGQTLEVNVSPGALQTERISFIVPAAGYHQAMVRAQFSESSGTNASPSLLSFGVETTPCDQDFTVLPCSFTLPPQKPDAFVFQAIDDPRPFLLTSRAGPWLGINGLEIAEVSSPAGTIPGETASLENPSLLPGEPPMAITTVTGLPAGTRFLRLAADRPWGVKVRVRVDLVDDVGQRFSVFENCGLSYSASSSEAWLNLADFHPYVWGRFVPHHPFQPQNVREIQLRFYFDRLRDPVHFQMDVMGLPQPPSS